MLDRKKEAFVNNEYLEKKCPLFRKLPEKKKVTSPYKFLINTNDFFLFFFYTKVTHIHERNKNNNK